MLHRQLFRATEAVLAGKRVTYSPEEMIPGKSYGQQPARHIRRGAGGTLQPASGSLLHIQQCRRGDPAPEDGPRATTAHFEAESVNALVPIVHWQNDLNLSLTVVNIVTWDRAGLFYKLAGAFSVAGLSIVSSKAITRADHITVDTFYVVDSTGGVVQNPALRPQWTVALKRPSCAMRTSCPPFWSRSRR
jgi:UTP:GlnB (protein PII) uridylyltransferase